MCNEEDVFGLIRVTTDNVLRALEQRYFPSHTLSGRENSVAG